MDQLMELVARLAFDGLPALFKKGLSVQAKLWRRIAWLFVLSGMGCFIEWSEGFVGLSEHWVKIWAAVSLSGGVGALVALTVTLMKEVDRKV